MTSAQAQGKGQDTESAARSAGEGTLSTAGRVGFVAQGAVYVLIGALAIQTALGGGGESADQQGALGQVAAQPFGKVMLWALAVGFGCMALWLGARAVRGSGRQQKAAARLLDGGTALFYVSLCWATAAFAAGGGQGASGNATSRSWTASVLKLPYGRALVAALGLLLLGVGVVLAVRAAMRRFQRQLDLEAMSDGTRRAVTGLGLAGGVARGIVFAAAGIFVLFAAVRFDAHEAKGMDATLRSFTHTPIGPWLLVAVAIGLILFGVFCFASARWHRL